MPARHNNSSATGDNANTHPHPPPAKPSARLQSRGRYPPAYAQPHPNPAESSHVVQNQPSTTARLILSMTRCKGSTPSPDEVCKPDRTNVTYQNARRLGEPAFLLSTSGIQQATTRHRSFQDYPTPRYNSISCCKPQSTCSITRSAPKPPCNRRYSTLSSTCLIATVRTVSRSRPPTRKKDFSRKEPWRPPCYISRLPPCRIRLSSKTTVPQTVYPWAEHPENPNILHHTRVQPRSK